MRSGLSQGSGFAAYISKAGGSTAFGACRLTLCQALDLNQKLQARLTQRLEVYKLEYLLNKVALRAIRP